MSVHRDCGEEVKWMKRSGEPGRWLPPMEYAGSFYIEDEDGAGKQVTAYKIHHCDPEVMEAWLERCHKVAQIKQGDLTDLSSIEVRAVAADVRRQQVWDTALKVACPTCEAPVNVKCHSLARNLRNQGITQEILNPHPARIEASANQEV